MLMMYDDAFVIDWLNIMCAVIVVFFSTFFLLFIYELRNTVCMYANSKYDVPYIQKYFNINENQ